MKRFPTEVRDQLDWLIIEEWGHTPIEDVVAKAKQIAPGVDKQYMVARRQQLARHEPIASYRGQKADYISWDVPDDNGETDEQKLVRMAGKVPPKELAIILNRTYCAVRTKASHYGISISVRESRRVNWEDKEELNKVRLAIQPLLSEGYTVNQITYAMRVLETSDTFA